MSRGAVAGGENPSAYGSFRDSLRAPVHRWFTYPAGYSHKLVESKIRQYGLKRGDWIADPFLGTGTTSLSAGRKASTPSGWKRTLSCSG